MNSVTHNTNSSQRIRLSGLLKLVAVLVLILVVGVLNEQYYWTTLCLGAALGMFLAEHFASTRTREFLFLICLPAALGCMATLLLSLRGSVDFDAAAIGLWMPLILLVGVIPAAISVVGLSVLSSLIFKLTGLRLLKFDWSSALKRDSED